MNLGLFGGTFDPIHLGHIALARAARERFELGRVYFVPAHVPPHKNQPLASYFHRYAMVVLATMGEKAFVPSLLEAPVAANGPLPGNNKSGKTAHGRAGANYTIDTVGRLRETLKKSDRLFLLLGIDAFNDIAKWRQAEELLAKVDVVVASRPGYSLADVANALPENLRPTAAITKPFARQPAKGELVLRGATVHLLEGVHQKVSATEIRAAVLAKRALGKLVDPAVAEYIKKMGLYGL